MLRRGNQSLFVISMDFDVQDGGEGGGGGKGVSIFNPPPFMKIDARKVIDCSKLF